jgi:hypothetical protein
MRRFTLALRRHAGIVLLAATLVGVGFYAGRALADQPHMHAALKDLQAAKASLETAANDKGGHRAKALELVNGAIAEVREGIEFDRKH